jgi:hypothetical protein
VDYIGTIFMNFPQPQCGTGTCEPAAVYQYSWKGRYTGVDVSSGYTSFETTRGKEDRWVSMLLLQTCSKT